MTEQWRSYPKIVGSGRYWGYVLCQAFSVGAFYIFIGGAPLVASAVFRVVGSQIRPHHWIDYRRFCRWCFLLQSTHETMAAFEADYNWPFGCLRRSFAGVDRRVMWHQRTLGGFWRHAFCGSRERSNGAEL